MFLWEAAPILLSRKGYATSVRRDCLALSLWLLTETHAAGEEKSLAPPLPSAKESRRRQRFSPPPPPSSAAAGAGAGGSGPGAHSASAPNLAAALNAENLVAGDEGPAAGGAGAGGVPGGTEDDGSGRAGHDTAAAAGRGQYWSAHLSLVSGLLRSGIVSCPTASCPFSRCFFIEWAGRGASNPSGAGWWLLAIGCAVLYCCT